MVRYQAGDHDALGLLVAELSTPLLRFLSSGQLQMADVEDLLQECWMRIHRARHTYRASEPLLPWIYAIARHTRLDDFRRRKRRVQHELSLGEGAELCAATPREPQSNVLAWLDHLPEGQREVLLLLKVSGMSVEEVARATGSTAGAVKQKAHRAYVTLRKLLKGD
jgi:RNA polymerase sigma-70 factor (ECF subfamily)